MSDHKCGSCKPLSWPTSLSLDSKGPAKRGHIVAATFLTWSCFPHVDSFCHARNIYGGHKFCVLDCKNYFLKILVGHISCVRAARNNVATFCHGLGNIAGHHVAALRAEGLCEQGTTLLPPRVLILLGPKQHVLADKLRSKSWLSTVPSVENTAHKEAFLHSASRVAHSRRYVRLY